MLIKEDINKVANLLVNAGTGRINDIELKQLITISKTLLIPYLYKTKKDFLGTISKFGLDIYDVCFDILSKIFKRDTSGRFILIISLLENLNDTSNNEINLDIFLSYQGLLRKIADITINELYSELDPIGHKILRNIKNNLPNDRLDIRESILGKVIFCINIDNDHLPYINLDQFHSLFFYEIEKNKGTKYLLYRIYECLIQFDEFRKEIKLNDAVTLFKKYYNVIEKLEEFDNDYDNYLQTTNFNFYDMDIQLLKQKLIETIVKKLVYYYQNTLINKNQLKAMYETILIIIDDITSGIGFQYSLYEYLKENYDLSKEEYHKTFKSKMEYLIKLIKKDIVEFLS